MTKNIIVKDLLENIDKIDENLNVFFPKNKNITKDTQSILLTDKELEEIDEMHDNVFDNKYYGIGVDVLKDIIENLNQQVEHPTENRKLEALIFYIDNDAFIECT